MPCILKVRIGSARGLPIMDRASELTDAYVEVRFGDQDPQRTRVCRKSLTPVWQQDFRFEITNDAQLQDEPLELKVFDYDAITADNGIGIVMIDLNPLLSCPKPEVDVKDAADIEKLAATSLGKDENSAIPLDPNEMILAGWFPIHDTIRGVRGELYVQVKLHFFGDTNPFKESSAGKAVLLGLVEEVITEADPDYHWVDNFRTSRSSNEASQRVLQHLTCQIRRMVGRKVLEMGGNVVLGYRQYIQMEPWARSITARAIGTAAWVPEQAKRQKGTSTESSSSSNSSSSDESSTESSESDNNSDSERLHEMAIAIDSNLYPPALLPPKTIELLTITALPVCSITAMGGLVSARSIRLISESSENLNQFSATTNSVAHSAKSPGLALLAASSANIRDRWLGELREDIRGHAKQLGCNVVLGYNESIVMHEDMYILSAEGTACRVNHRAFYPRIKRESRRRFRRAEGQEKAAKHKVRKRRPRFKIRPCTATHLPSLRQKSNSIRRQLYSSPSECHACRRKMVPEIILSTTDLPVRLRRSAINGGLIESYVVRKIRKRREGEPLASAVSSTLPFLEYDLHRQLLFKLRFRAHNAIYGLRIQLTVSDGAFVAIASGTSFFLPSLGLAQPLRISRNLSIEDEEDERLVTLQQQIAQDAIDNHASVEEFLLCLKLEHSSDFARTDTSSSSDSSSDSDSSSGNENRAHQESSSSSSSDTDDEESSKHSYRKGVSVVQIDDEADEEMLLLLQDSTNDAQRGLIDFLMGGTLGEDQKDLEIVEQMITVHSRGRLPLDSRHPALELSHFLARVYGDALQQASLAFKDPKRLHMHSIRHALLLCRDGEVQITLTGAVIGPKDATLMDSYAQEGSSSNKWNHCFTDSSSSSDDGDSDDREEDEVWVSLSSSSDEEGSESDDQEGGTSHLRRESLNDSNSVSKVFSSSPLVQTFRFRKRMPSSSGDDPNRQKKEPRRIRIASSMNHIDLSPSTLCHGGRYLGTITIPIFREIHASDIASTSGNLVPGGHSHARFVQSLLADVKTMLRAQTIALDGDACISVRVDWISGSGVHETLKNQIHGVLIVSGDVVAHPRRDYFLKESPMWPTLTIGKLHA